MAKLIYSAIASLDGPGDGGRLAIGEPGDLQREQPPLTLRPLGQPLERAARGELRLDAGAGIVDQLATTPAAIGVEDLQARVAAVRSGESIRLVHGDGAQPPEQSRS